MQMGEGPHERYVLLRPLNSGGYGTVYEAQDRNTGERVAIKKSDLLSEADDPNDQGVPVVVLREGAVLRRLQHPNVLRLFDIYLHLGHHNFVFELCDCNLREYMAQLEQKGEKWMDQGKLVDLMRQIFEGVAYCHERRITHR